MATLIYSRPSLKDIENIKDFIALDSIAQAHRFIKIIRARIMILKQYLRQLLYKSYGIIYQYSDDTVTIITIHHQSRLLENIQVIKNYKE